MVGMKRLQKLLRHRYSRTLLWFALLLYTALLTYYSLRPAYAGQPPTGGASPYLLHFLAYMGMSVLVLFTFLDLAPSSSLLLLGSVFAYSVLIELVQIPIPGRFFSWYDVLMNGLGAFIPGLFLNKTCYKALWR